MQKKNFYKNVLLQNKLQKNDLAIQNDRTVLPHAKRTFSKTFYYRKYGII